MKRRAGEPARPKIQTVLVSGEHNLLRAFLRAWLARFNRLQVVAESNDVLHAFEMVQKHKPTLVLMDFDTLQSASLDFLIKMRLGYPFVKVIIYFAYTNDAFAVQVIRAGASGFVLKSAESEDMEKAIKTVLNGGVYLSPDFLKSFGSKLGKKGVADKQGRLLSRKDAELFKLLALGLSGKAAAMELKVSAQKLGARIKALLRQLGLKDTAALIRYAIRSGFVPA